MTNWKTTTQAQAFYPDHQTSQSVTSWRVYQLYLLQIETEAGQDSTDLIERGFSDGRGWKISQLKNERG